jgi:NAD(P)-dependent dehydrogenase (short-subunit alcohol dehydrogenase family)
MARLSNKTALVTGGTSGIGLETARRFIEEGARVIVTGTNPDNIAEAQRVLGPDALVLKADAGDVAAQKVVADTVKAHFGTLDIAFLNAGVADFRPVESWDEAGFDRSFAINVKGPYFLVQALLPLLSNPASIVLNTSINAHLGMPGSSIYAATKAAFLSMARTLSGELIGRGIRVNAVSPGPVRTPLHDRLGATPEENAAIGDAIKAQIPLGRYGHAKEIADAVVFFASSEGAFAVGTELILDGGMATL